MFYVCSNLKRKLFDRFPKNLQQTHQLGYSCTRQDFERFENLSTFWLKNSKQINFICITIVFNDADKIWARNSP